MSGTRNQVAFCLTCGSTRVEATAWIELNPKHGTEGLSNSEPPSSDTYCARCQTDSPAIQYAHRTAKGWVTGFQCNAKKRPRPLRTLIRACRENKRTEY